jgi:anti-anti-sigma factor
MKKTTFRLKSTGGVTVLEAHGAITIGEVQNFREHILKWIGKEGELVLNLKDVDALDTSALQLIYALKTAIKANNRKLKIEQPDNQEFVQLLTRTGFITLLTQTHY